MKKVTMIAFSLLLVFSLVACSANAAETSSQAAAPASVTEDNSVAEAAESGESDGGTVTITHSLGDIEVPYNPQRIAILDMSVLDMLDAWNLGDRVVGVPKQSEVSYLMAYVEDDSIAHLGSLKEVDMETLNATEPDIIFIGGRLSAEYDNLNAIAPTVLLTIDNEAGYMKGFTENVNTIAAIFGMEDEAADLLGGFDERLAAIRVAAEGQTAIGGMVTSGSFNTLGNNGRCSILFNEAGFENLADGIESTHGDAASFELLLDENPDYIFVLDRDAAINAEGSNLAQEVMENEIVMKTSAYENGQIVYLTPDVWYLAEGGITATDTMIRDLEAGVLG